MKKILLILCVIGFGASAIAEEILPLKAPLNRYTSEWENSPFNRVVMRVTKSTAISAFAKNLVLEGLVSDDADGITAYVRDNTDGSFAVITEQPTGDQPLHIISHSGMDDPREASITISNGSEEAEISYEQDAMTRTIQQDTPAKPAKSSEPASEIPAAPGKQNGPPGLTATDNPSPPSQGKASPTPAGLPSPQNGPPGADAGNQGPPINQQDGSAPPGARRSLLPGQ